MFKSKVKHSKQTMKNSRTGKIIVSTGEPELLKQWVKLGYKRTKKELS